MANSKMEKACSDRQKSFNPIRQQVGLVFRTGWDEHLARDPHRRTHSTSQRDRQKVHSPSNLPRLSVTPDGVPNRPMTDLRRGPRIVVPPLFSEKASCRKETLRKSVNFPQFVTRPKYSNMVASAGILSSGLTLPSSVLVRQQGLKDETVSSGTWSHCPELQRELAACRLFRENKSFAWNFLDLFILDVLRDELVPDILMEVLSCYHTQCPIHPPTRMIFHTKSKLQQMVKLDVLKQQPAVAVLDTVLEEVVSELTLGLIRSIVEEFVGNHLTSVAINESLTEVIVETIQPMVPQLVREAVSETLLEEILQEVILPEVLEEEMRNVAVSLLREYDTEIYEQEQQAVRTYASKRLIDLFFLESLLKMTGSQGRDFFGKVELDRLLDSWMLDILLGQHLNITQHNQLTVENVVLRDYHTKAFTDVVLDVVLRQMSEHIDEDLADLSQYEQQMEEANFIVD